MTQALVWRVQSNLTHLPYFFFERHLCQQVIHEVGCLGIGERAPDRGRRRLGRRLRDAQKTQYDKRNATCCEQF